MKTELKFLNTKEVSEILGCSLPKARDIMRRADFPLVIVGRCLKVEESAFREWAQKRRI